MLNNLKLTALLVTASCISAFCHAQSNAIDSSLTSTPEVVQISGMVVTGDSLSPLPFATVALAFGLAGEREAFPLAREVAVADVAAAPGGVLVCLPGAPAGGDSGASFSPVAAVIRAEVELAGDGCRLVVLRGGDGAALAAAANVRLENRTRETVWVRQIRRIDPDPGTPGTVNPGRFVPAGAWAEVGTGSCVPWALEDPARFEAREAASAPVSRRERGASRFAGHEDEDEDDDADALDHEDEDASSGTALAGSEELLSSVPAFVEVRVGDCPASNACNLLRCRT